MLPKFGLQQAHERLEFAMVVLREEIELRECVYDSFMLTLIAVLWFLPQ